MNLIDQLDVYNAGRQVEIQAERALQQANNSISSAVADYQAWAGTVAGVGYDADTLAAIAARKDALKQAATAALTQMLATIDAL
jgi:predicted RNA-binding protein with PIN domain